MSCEIHNKSNYDITEMKPLVQDMYSFADKRFGFNKPPSINFVSDPNNHPMLGKTAHYDPSSMEIVVYTDGRHPKDMMRSIAHELVHHKQNLDGHFDGESASDAGYAQKDPHLRKMEKQAYLQGNMCFRDWEDGYKAQHKDIFYERRIRKMSTKKWKNKELNTLLNERWGFSMDLGKLNENKIEEKQFANDDSLDGDKDGKPKWADPDDPANKEKEEKNEIMGPKGALTKEKGIEDSEKKTMADLEDKDDKKKQVKMKEAEEMPVDKLAEKILNLATVEKLRAALKYAEKMKKEKKDDKKDS